MAKRKVAETYPDFAAAITDEEMQRVESAAHGFGINRRVLLASLTRSRGELIVGGEEMSAEKTGELICQMLDIASEYKKHLDAMLDMVNLASARLIAAGETMVERGLVE